MDLGAQTQGRQGHGRVLRLPDHRAQRGSARRPPEGDAAILTEPQEWEPWLSAPWKQAQALQRPLPDGALRIVLRGEKEDPGLLTEA